MTFIKKRHRRIKKTCAVQISNREEEPPVVSDLVAARWRAAIWSAELENKIIPRWHRHCLDRGLPIYVAFSVGKRAAEHLVKCHHATVLQIAGRRMRGRFRPHKKDGKEYNTELFDDFVATGMLALWESMLAFERNRGARLNTFARHGITGAIKDEAKAYYAGGIAGETRVQRLAYAYPRYSPEWIVALAKKRRIRCTLQDAEVALQQVSELGKRVHYSTIEGLSIQDDAEGRSPDGRYRCGDELIVGDYLTDGKARGKYSLFSKSQLSPQLLHHEGWRTERKYYQWPDYPRCGKSGVVDKLVRDSDSRDERRLKHIGPRAYAAELWLRDIKPIPRPEIQMAGYAIPVNTAATASDSTDWKSDMERIEAASKANPPLVWTQHDKSGAWRTIDLRPQNEIYQENAALTAGRNDDHDNVRRKSGNTHRRIRDPRRDRTGNESRRESGYDDDVRHNATRPNR